MTRILKYVFALAVCLLLGSSLKMHADARHPSQGYTSSFRTSSYPVYTTTYQSQMTSSSYTPAARSISAFDSDFGQGAKLSSFFRSSTADNLLSGDSPMGSTPHGNARRGFWDDPADDDNPMGTVTNPQPVGEPLVLLVMAVLYIACRVLTRRGVIRLHRSAQTAAAE